jgi:hypothetical protein
MAETVFEPRSPKVADLLSDIHDGTLALPELQRPFVWKTSKVRDLLDSMYRGYPVGYLLFWRTPESAKTRVIGEVKTVSPSTVIIDGQQRLTSLYAVFRGAHIYDDNFRSIRIRIAFRPRDGRFEVANSATDKDPEFIPDVSVLWSEEQGPYKTRNAFIARLKAARPDETEDEIEILEGALNRVYQLHTYPFSALELASRLNEEEAAEIFVRINSAGITLNQADFILTLMSVFWDDGRRDLERFARACRQPATGVTPYNEVIAPSADQMLRVAIALAFRRAALSAVYTMLRGKDVETKAFSTEVRDRQFATLKDAQAFALDLTNWHDFLKSVRQAGYRTSKIIASQTSVAYAYSLYLIGLRDFHIDRKRLRDLIARWFFMTAVTRRYTGSSESAFEKDLARLRSISTAEEFETVLDDIVNLTLTKDFWELTLPSLLATSSSRSPYLFAYEAALDILGASALFSSVRVGELMDQVAHGKRKGIERHHLFPQAVLRRSGITSTSDINQIANLAIVEWIDNANISDSEPSVYWPQMVQGMSPKELDETSALHALPEGWHGLDYAAFLVERQRRMAAVIHKASEVLRTGRRAQVETERPSVADLVKLGESSTLEFKASARWSLRSGGRDERLEHKILVTLAAFMNADGGTLLIGVDDDGEPLGLENDYSLLRRQDSDGWRSWLTDHVSNGLDKAAPANLRVEFDHLEGVDVCRVTVRPSTRPIWVSGPSGQEFYVRFDNSTRQLLGDEILDYVADRWGELAPRTTVAASV